MVLRHLILQKIGGQQLGGEGLLAARVMADLEPVSEISSTPDGEALIRDLLEQARKVRGVAERHIEGEATSLAIVTSQSMA